MGAMSLMLQRGSHRRVVECGHAPQAVILFEHADAELVVRWLRCPVGINEAANLVRYVHDGDVGSDKADHHTLCTLRGLLQPASEPGGEKLLNRWTAVRELAGDIGQLPIIGE